MAVTGGVRPPDEPAAVEVGDDVKQGLRIEPLDPQPVGVLDHEEVLEELLLAGRVGHEHVPAAPPLDLLSVGLFPAG